MKNEQGLTITEVLVVIVIITTLIGVAVPTYQGSLRMTQMNTGLSKIVSDMRKAQARSMATGENYGYQFTDEGESYSYIQDGETVEVIEARELPEQVSIDGTTFTDNKVTFGRSGAASEGGEITVVYRDGTTRAIEVVKITGKVKLK